MNIGAIVTLTLITAGNTTVLPAQVTGFTTQDGQEKPDLHLAYLHPQRQNALGSPDWRNAYDRLTAVKHVSDPAVAAGSEGAYWEESDSTSVKEVRDDSPGPNIADRIAFVSNELAEIQEAINGKEVKDSDELEADAELFRRVSIAKDVLDGSEEYVGISTATEQSGQQDESSGADHGDENKSTEKEDAKDPV